MNKKNYFNGESTRDFEDDILHSYSVSEGEEEREKDISEIGCLTSEERMGIRDSNQSIAPSS